MCAANGLTQTRSREIKKAPRKKPGCGQGLGKLLTKGILQNF